MPLQHFEDLAGQEAGVAGPGGATATKPVGLVHLAVAHVGRTTTHRQSVFEGDRQAVRQATVIMALQMLLDELDADQLRE